MFALAGSPPSDVTVGGLSYALVSVFKHDFWAATCLYELRDAVAAPGAMPRIVIKFGRAQQFCGLPLEWYGRWLQRHEEDIYRRLSGIEGVPRWAGCVGATGFAIEYIDARPLDHFDRPPAGFFDRLATVFDAIHQRGVAYCDANKRSNILVGPDSRPTLIDFQISFGRRDDLPWPLRSVVAWLVRYFQRSDLYHLYKHKRRLAESELRPEEAELSKRRGALHRLHRRLTDPWRAMRRRFLRRQSASGQLVSPTQHLEDHDQPEKATWREPKRDEIG